MQQPFFQAFWLQLWVQESRLAGGPVNVAQSAVHLLHGHVVFGGLPRLKGRSRQHTRRLLEKQIDSAHGCVNVLTLESYERAGDRGFIVRIT